MFWVCYQQVLGKALIFDLSAFSEDLLVGERQQKVPCFALSALQAIMNEQVLELNKLGIVAVVIGEGQKIDDETVEVKYEVVLET